MARKNNTKKNRTTRTQGRPQGYVPPRLAQVKRDFDTSGVRVRNMPEAVDFLDLLNMLGATAATALLDRPIYRFTEAAFDEARDEIGERAFGDLRFQLADLPHSKGVVLWEDPEYGNYAGVAWEVDPFGRKLILTGLDTRSTPNPFVAAHVSELLPFGVVVHTRHTHIELDGIPQPAYGVVLSMVMPLLARIVMGASAENVATVDEVRGTTSTHGGSRPVRFYDVRSTPEEGAARRAGSTGGRAGWHLQHRSHTRGYFRKNGTWVEPFTRGKHLPERPRVITGTTIRSGVAA